MLNATASRASRGLVAAGLAALLTLCAAPPPRADAAIRGTPGYSGTLSSNPVIRKQQLLCDPEDPMSGSSSTRWDPAISRLSGIVPVRQSVTDGYVITQAVVATEGGFVDVTAEANTGQPIMVPLQTGYAQVFWQSTSSPSPATVDSSLAQGYEFRDQGGVEGTDTHRLEFDYLPAADDVVASYTTYADPGPQGGGRGIQPDTLTSPLFMPNTVGPAGITPVTVSGALVPEPSTLVLLGLVAIPALVRRRQRSR